MEEWQTGRQGHGQLTVLMTFMGLGSTTWSHEESSKVMKMLSERKLSKALSVLVSGQSMRK